jgi:hypothetical protein
MPSVFSQIPSELGGTLFSEASQMTFADENPPTVNGNSLLVQHLNLVYRQPFSRFYELSSSHVYYLAGPTRGTASLERVFGPSSVMGVFYETIGSESPAPQNAVDFTTLKADATDPDADNSSSFADCCRVEGCALNSIGFNAVMGDMAVTEGTVLDFSSLGSLPRPTTESPEKVKPSGHFAA